MIPRALEAVLKKAASQYSVVTVTGPRQSGKTTLVKAVSPDHRHVSLEAPDTRQAALDDLRGFLGALGRKVVLDEAQRAPELWKRRVHAGQDPDLYCWRDSAGHEVDLLVDRGAGAAPLPIELKAGETVARDAFRGLEYVGRVCGPGAPGLVLIHAGDASYLRQRTVVHPWWGF